MLHLSALLAIGIAAAPVTPPGVSLAAEGESPTWVARAELVGMQTLHGMTEGLLLAGLFQGDNGLGAVLAVVGGAAGGVSTWLLTRNGVSGGPAAAINSGFFWGVSEALLFVLLRDHTLSIRNPVHMATGIAFSIALTGLGALVASEIRPNAGWVALTNSMGFWGALVVGVLVLPISVELSSGFAL